MVGVSEGKHGGLHVYMIKAWRDWVDSYHETVDDAVKKDFMALWYPKEVSELTVNAKALIQQAFYGGYEAGFTDRLLKGDANE